MVLLNTMKVYSMKTIKTHGHMSVAKKAVWCTSVLFIGTANSPFSSPCISITTGLIIRFLSNSHILCPPYMRLYIPNLKEISPVVRKIHASENCPIFFTFFFFALFYKNNFEAPFSWIDLFQTWHTYKALCGLSKPKFRRYLS